MPASNFRDHRSYLVHLLRTMHGRGPVLPSGIYDEVADCAGVTSEQRRVQGSRGSGNPVYRNRIQFARQALVDAGLLVGSSDAGWRRGVWQLTSEGERLAEEIKSDAELDQMLLERTAEGARRRAQEREESRALAGLDDESPLVGEDEPANDGGATLPSIREQVDAANGVVRATMLDHVRGMNDRAFEHLVGTVLKAALRAESVRVTQRSRDGGIDGVLQFDAVGMRTAVFEAKRYSEGNVVGRALIDAFATAARRRRATHALFVTSSRFSTEAEEAARDESVRLINGIAFVELMAEHGIGLRARDSFVVYEIDPAWSLEGAGDAPAPE